MKIKGRIMASKALIRFEKYFIATNPLGNYPTLLTNDQGDFQISRRTCEE